MLLAVVRAPLSFFEQTPLGRIMNLFSRDQYVIDEVLIRVLGGFFRTMLVVSGESLFNLTRIKKLRGAYRNRGCRWRNVPMVLVDAHPAWVCLPRDHALLPGNIS
jgi:ABC-type multidrug transport system fused ATPase/permease subunit